MRFICFSSGTRALYRDDVIRAMAMPPGCELTFRYRLKHLAHSVRNRLEAGGIGPADEVLICYLDQSDRNKAVDFVPVRFATLKEAPVIGDFVVLRMRVGQFAYAANFEPFSEEVRVQSAEVPKWADNTDSQYATGAFWVEVNDYPKSVIESTSISNWQTTVGHLVKRRDFVDAGPFYHVTGLRNLKTGAVLDMAEGQYSVDPGTEYELMIDHYLPRWSLQNRP